MAMSDTQKETVRTLIRNVVLDKLENYHPEPAEMPFHTNLFGARNLLTYRLIQSFNTSFGSAYEKIAQILASSKFEAVQTKTKAGGRISSEAQLEIQRVMDALARGDAKPDKKAEIERIRKVVNKGEMVSVKPTLVDLAFVSHQGDRYLCDLKTVKPNKGDAREFKRTLLEWVAVVLAENPRANIHTFLAVPYNPYEPKPYHRWTLQGMLDLSSEVKVAEEFWDFIGGEGSYLDLVACFESVGMELRQKIDDFVNQR